MVRIFNAYGPRIHPADGLVSNFIMPALRDEPITIYGDGTQRRSFCHVDDLIDGFLALMDSEPGRPGPVNIGSPVEFTIRQLAETVIEMIGSKSELIRLPLPQDDPLQRKPDISLAHEWLGWEPKVPLESGLTQTIDYFRSLAYD